MEIDPYQILGISRDASLEEIKSAYRSLVKEHHPDKGGDEITILNLNAAWEILKNKDDLNSNNNYRYQKLNNEYNEDISKKNQSSHEDNYLSVWINSVYSPIDRLMYEIIKPFSKTINELSADPYDDVLMEDFINYIERSQKRIKKINQIYTSNATPSSVRSFGLSLYHCFSEIGDALDEFERYAQGYVDSYLHDGQEMLREAKKKRLLLQKERRNLPNQ